MKEIIDIAMLVAFVGFMVFLLRGFTKKTMERDRSKK